MVTLKIRSRSTKSNQIITPSQCYNTCSIPIYPLQKVFSYTKSVLYPQKWRDALYAAIHWMCKNMKQVAQRATIAHLSPMCQGQISFKNIRTHPSFNACSCYMKVSKGSNQKQQRKSGNIIFPIISLWGYFLDAQVVGGPIWPKFELIHNIMHVLVTSKSEKDRININRDYVMTSIF